MIDQKDLDKLLELAKKAETPELKFDPRNIGGSFCASYGLVCDGLVVPGINIDVMEYWHGEESKPKMAARAEYVALCCNLAPELVRLVQELRQEIQNLIEDIENLEGTEDDHDQM